LVDGYKIIEDELSFGFNHLFLSMDVTRLMLFAMLADIFYDKVVPFTRVTEVLSPGKTLKN